MPHTAIRLRPRPLRSTRFILDVHLGKLARYLRMLGFDVAYVLVRKNTLPHQSGKILNPTDT